MPVYPKSPGKHRVVIFHKGIRRDYIVKGKKSDAESFEAREMIRLESESEAPRARVVPSFLSAVEKRYETHAEMHLRASTWRVRSHMLVDLKNFFGGLKLTEITPSRVDGYKKFRRKAGLKAISINNELRALRAVLNFLREECGMQIPKPKFKDLPQPGSGKVQVWSAAEVAAFLDACKRTAPAILPMMVFLVNTGCRKGEALSLNWDHIDMDHRQVLIHPSDDWQPKNNKPREIPMSDELHAWLDGDRKSSKWVFPTRAGDRYAAFPKLAFYRAVRATVLDGKPANLAGGPHVLRHSFASFFLQKNPDLFLLARILGHSDIAVTRIYSHLLPDHLARARNAVNFGAGIGPAAFRAELAWKKKSAKK